MNHLIVYTEYRCQDCGQTLTLATGVYHTHDYKVAQEYALVVNDAKPEMIRFETLHKRHVYTYDLKLEPVGTF